MTDSGRALYKAVESDDRLTHYTIGGVHKSIAEVVQAAVDLLKAGDVALVGSAHSSVEEQFYHQCIADRSNAQASLVSHYGEGDEFFIRKTHRICVVL